MQQISDGERNRRLHRIGVAGARLQPLAFGEFLCLRRDDVAVFSAAAEVFDHVVIVRAANPKSLHYIGQKNFTPKPIDCKPKTADANCYVESIGAFVECAGLVVDPTLVSYAAFASQARRGKARDAWTSFVEGNPSPALRRRVFRRRSSKGFYAVDTLRSSRRYGCLMLSLQDPPADDFNLAGRGWTRFRQTEMRYIHGDYDLYGLIDLHAVPAPALAGPLAARAPRVLHERLHGVAHHFSEKFPQIQQFLNRGFGCDMIQHASQDHVAHQGDLLYVFYPDGLMYQVDASVDVIREMYELLFGQSVTG